MGVGKLGLNPHGVFFSLHCGLKNIAFEPNSKDTCQFILKENSHFLNFQLDAVPKTEASFQQRMELQKEVDALKVSFEKQVGM